MIAALLAASCCVMVAMQPPQQPPRDARQRTAETATASISGTIVSDDAESRKLRRVRVTLNGAAMDAGGRTVITDDEGRYRFTALPAGQYGVTAVKDGYVPARYGSGRPPRLGSLRTIPSTGLSVRNGESITADFRLARGAVITGIVTDADGRPEEGVIVTAASYQFISGVPERRLSVASPLLRTDDRGVYRIYGLRAGEYIVSAQAPNQYLSLKASTTDGRSMATTPVYFPSATDVTAATVIKVAAAEERTGVDIQMRYVPTATVSGIVAFPSGTIFARVVLTRMTGSGALESVSGTTTQPDGSFLLTNVVPGRYTVFAVAQGPSTSAESTPMSGAGSIGIDVEGEDITGVAITMSPPFSVSGTIVFDGAAPPDVRLRGMTLPLVPAAASMGGVSPYFQSVDASHFTISALLPGTYRALGATVPGIRTPIGNWWLKSILIGGREALDGAVDIRQPTDDVVVTVSGQASTLTGVARDAGGAPLGGASVVVFSADRAAWVFNSRRVAGVRVDARGRYTIRNLPPGEYRVALAVDLEPGEWFDPDILQGLLATASPVTISGNEAKTLDLILR